MKRTFILGDEWIYYKLYCGKRTADEILTNTIKLLTEKLIQQKVIDKWFFIRYSDPDFHLKIRFHCNTKENLTQIIYEFNQSIKPYINDGFIWKLQTDTYKREIERYGFNTIENAEHLFFIDSQWCLSTLNLIKNENVMFMCIIRSIDNLLNIFELSNQEKITFVQKNLFFLKTEFNPDRNFNKQLYKKYNSLGKQITLFMTNIDEEYIILGNLLKEKTERLIIWRNNILTKTSKITIINYYLSSYIHMSVNRFFRDKQKLYELLCYDSLNRYYNYKKANTQR